MGEARVSATGRPWLRALNFGQVIDDAVRLHPDRRAIVTSSVDVSYGQLAERAGRVATLIAGRGVGRGETVAVAVGNDWRFVECLLGVLRVGAVALLINTKLGADALSYIADHSETQLVIGHPDLERQAIALQAGAPDACSILMVGDDDLPIIPMGDAYRSEADALAILMYTSGSTGTPKGVMLSHSNTWWQARSDVRTMLLDGHDCALVAGPMYHANALWGLVLPMLYVGGSMAILPTFEPRAVLEAIERYGVTYTSGTPSMFSLMLTEAERHLPDLTSLEFLTCGSAPVSAELMQRLGDTLHCEVIEGYGLTEGGGNIGTPRWGVKKLGSCGLPVPDVELRVVDAANPGRDCEVDEIGELWTRSPANALGYLKQPDVTAEKFVEQGWLRTGDLFSRDEQGYCYFHGRADDMISVGGENVYPKEVEDLILRHPGVSEAVVIAVSHPVKGHAPVAWVVRRPGASVTEEEIRRHALANGPSYAHPRRVFFVPALPISGTNKPDRAALARLTNERLPDGLQSTSEPVTR